MDQDALEWRQRGHPELSVETLPGVGPKVAERLAAPRHRDARGSRRVRPARASRLGAGDGVRRAAHRAGGDGRLHGRAAGAGSADAAPEPEARRGRGRRRAGRACDRALVQPVLARRAAHARRPAPPPRRALGGRARSRSSATSWGSGGLHTVGLVPVYRASETVSATKLRELTELALPLARWLPDPLPGEGARRGGAAAARRCAARLPPPDRPRRRRRRARAARARGAPRPALRPRAPAPGDGRRGDRARRSASPASSSPATSRRCRSS